MSDVYELNKKALDDLEKLKNDTISYGKDNNVDVEFQLKAITDCIKTTSDILKLLELLKNNNDLIKEGV